MAHWQDLHRMLLDETLSADEIIARLNVPPSRLKKMLNSQRLRQRLGAADDLVNRVHTQRLVRNTEQLSRRLIGLTESERPETARQACEHLLAECQKLISQSQEQRTVPTWLQWRTPSEERQRRREAAGSGGNH